MNDRANGAVIVTVSWQVLAGGINGRKQCGRVVEDINFCGVLFADYASLEMQVAERQGELKRQREQRNK